MLAFIARSEDPCYRESGCHSSEKRCPCALLPDSLTELCTFQDLNDALDFTDNDIRALSNFPLLKRLTTLYLSNNLVSRIDPRIAHSLPYLRTLVLTNNNLESLADVANALGKFPFLEFVSLMGNPLSRTKHYREYLIWKCKKVRVIDYKRVKNAVSDSHAILLFMRVECLNAHNPDRNE